jgi:hypothetical protein
MNTCHLPSFLVGLRANMEDQHQDDANSASGRTNTRRQQRSPATLPNGGIMATDVAELPDEMVEILDRAETTDDAATALEELQKRTGADK